MSLKSKLIAGQLVMDDSRNFRWSREQKLIAHILIQAKRDLDTRRNDVENFVNSPLFCQYCDDLDLDPQWARKNFYNPVSWSLTSAVRTGDLDG